MPLRTPLIDAAGVLLYARLDAPSKSTEWIGVTTDGAGQPIGTAVPYWTQLDFDPAYPVPSPGGRYILFLQAAEGGGIPYVFDRQSGRVRPLFSNKELYDSYALVGLPFGWHPDGRQVLIWVDSGAPSGLWLVDVEGGERTIITVVDSPPQGAAVAPDGQRVAYAIYKKGGMQAELWISYADGSLPNAIPDLLVSRLYGWSPDGNYILFLGDIANRTNKGESSVAGPLWVINPNTQEFHSLGIPFISGYAFEATWSPDGRYVAAVGTIPGQAFRCAVKDLPASEADTCRYQGTGVYVEDVKSGEAQLLSSGVSPAWSPDGSMLAFLSNRSGSPEVWIVRRDGSELRQATLDADKLSKSIRLAWMEP